MPMENRARGVLICWNLKEGSEGTLMQHVAQRFKKEPGCKS